MVTSVNASVMQFQNYSQCSHGLQNYCNLTGGAVADSVDICLLEFI